MSDCSIREFMRVTILMGWVVLLILSGTGWSLPTLGQKKNCPEADLIAEVKNGSFHLETKQLCIWDCSKTLALLMGLCVLLRYAFLDKTVPFCSSSSLPISWPIVFCRLITAASASKPASWAADKRKEGDKERETKRERWNWNSK